jgi:hypothetical protein
MPDRTNNLILRGLRAIGAGQDQHARNFLATQLHLSVIEPPSLVYGLSDARQNTKIDRLKHKMVRINRQLERVDGE